MERIIIINLIKKFSKAHNKRNGTLSSFLSIISSKESQKEFSVLKNINLTAKEGEIIGIVGKNGSGKSTLLRIISRIYKQDSGQIITKGKIIPLINLNIGLQPKLSMRENIYLCGTLFGLERGQIQEKFNSIIEFSELKDYIDAKIYQFSNGMLQRLAFSIAIHANPDILLLDEAFESTDNIFQEKCEKKIKELAKKGTTILLVSHDQRLIKRICIKTINIQK